MTPTLLPHQHVGADFLAVRRYALLADEPGAGKTAQVVEAARRINARNILVLCPTSVRHHWRREFLTWWGREDVTVQDGVPKDARDNKPGDVVPGVMICGHATMAREEAVVMLGRHGFDLVIVDESHEFRSAEAARAVWLLGATPKALWHHVDRMWLLSGSPIVNSAADLYPCVASLFSGGRHIPYGEFIARYTKLVPDAWKGFRPTDLVREAELKEWLRPHMLRRADFLNLPPRTLRTIPLQVSDQDLAPVVAMLRGLNAVEIERAIEVGLDPDEAMSRVRRALGIAKAPAAIDYIAELLCCGYGPVVAFYHHKDVRELMFSSLKAFGLRVSWIDGAVTGDKRAAAVDWFQDGKLDVLLVQTQAGGTGITLTRSNRSVTVEMPWTDVALSQSIARLHRITQTRPVQADILTGACWLDETMARVVTRKANAAKRLLTDA